MTPEQIESVMDDHLFTMDEELPSSGVWVTKIMGKPEASEQLAAAFSAQLAEKDAEINRLRQQLMENQSGEGYLSGQLNMQDAMIEHIQQYAYGVGNSEFAQAMKRKVDEYTTSLQQENQKLTALLQQASQQVEELKEYIAHIDYNTPDAGVERPFSLWNNLNQETKDRHLWYSDLLFKQWKFQEDKIKKQPTNHSDQGRETR